MPLSDDEVKRLMEIRKKQAIAENPTIRPEIDGVEQHDPSEDVDIIGGAKAPKQEDSDEFWIQEQYRKRGALIDDAMKAMRLK